MTLWGRDLGSGEDVKKMGDEARAKREDEALVDLKTDVRIAFVIRFLASKEADVLLLIVDDFVFFMEKGVENSNSTKNEQQIPKNSAIV